MMALEATIAGLRRAQPGLVARSRDEVVDVLGDVVDGWLAPGSSWFARAAELLPAATGFSPAMIRQALPTMLEPLRAPALADVLAREADARCGPSLILHVLAGNLPGLAAIPAALSLAVGSAALLKAGRGDRVFPALFTASITERDPALGACVAAVYWPGGDRGCEDTVLAAVDLVVASGDDATIADLAARARGRFIGHGHRISFAFVAREVADDPSAAVHAAERLAEDIAIWDQRGCLSPQLCFVEGSFDAALRFGSLVAEALRPLAHSFPPAPASTADRLALRRLREDSEWRRFGGGRAAVFASERDEDGTVVVEPDASFRPTPLNRSVRVQPVADVDALASVLAPARTALEGAGIAAAPARWTGLAERMTASGVHRISALGEMQRPPLDWRQGGRPRLYDWTIEAHR